MDLQVIGAGLGRTGTASLKVALEKLGFRNCYHFGEMMANVSHKGKFKCRRCWSIFKLMLIMLFLTVILSGCGGGGGGAISSSDPFLEGVFLDSPVEGLEYETATRSGMTDEDGTFLYHEGDTMRFYVGDIVLGEAPAQSVMTPVDLVDGATDETHPAVINMVRFLQTIDDDMNPENGITITESMTNAMVDYMIDFNISPDVFEYDLNVMVIMNIINEVDPSDHMRTMVSTEDAIDHFSNSMNNMMTDGTMNDGSMMSSGGGMI